MDRTHGTVVDWSYRMYRRNGSRGAGSHRMDRSTRTSVVRRVYRKHRKYWIDGMYWSYRCNRTRRTWSHRTSRTVGAYGTFGMYWMDGTYWFYRMDRMDGTYRMDGAYRISRNPGSYGTFIHGTYGTDGTSCFSINDL